MTNVTFTNGQPVRVNGLCESCGVECHSTLSLAPKLTLNTNAINFSQPCPECGGKVSASSGTYEVRDGVLVRIGDYVE